jgi:hypothetical protein
MKNQYRVTRPPRDRRRRAVRPDNFSLIPGSLLAEISEWQQFTDEQPRGTAVMVMPSPISPLRRVYRAVARVLKERGKTVKYYSAGR